MPKENLHLLYPPGIVGAVLTHRDQRPVVAHYGSAAGELAAGLQSVGLALRTDLIVRTVRLAGSASAGAYLPRAGGILFERGGWRCAALTNGRNATLVGCPSSSIFASTDADRDSVDQPQDLTVFNILGPYAPGLLGDLGLLDATGEPRGMPPFCETWLGSLQVRIISQTLTNFLLLGRTGDVGALWSSLTQAGRRHAAATVGVEAVERCLLIERARCRSLAAI